MDSNASFFICEWFYIDRSFIYLRMQFQLNAVIIHHLIIKAPDKCKAKAQVMKKEYKYLLGQLKDRNS